MLGGTCSNDIIDWAWAKCGHSLFMDEKAMMHCPQCNHTAKLCDCKFNCGDSKHGAEYIPFNDPSDAIEACYIAIKAVK